MAQVRDPLCISSVITLPDKGLHEMVECLASVQMDRPFLGQIVVSCAQVVAKSPKPSGFELRRSPRASLVAMLV